MILYRKVILQFQVINLLQAHKRIVWAEDEAGERTRVYDGEAQGGEKEKGERQELQN